MQNESDYVFKICIVGDDDVGRYSVLKRYLKDAIDELDYFTTMESNFAVKYLDIIPDHSEDSVRLRLHFWFFTEFMDTSRGSDDLRRFFSNASGVMFIFDLTRPETLSTIPEWIEKVYEMVGHRIPIVLLGNKSDLEILVDETEVKRLSEKFEIPYFYASAKLDEQISDTFEKLVSMVFQHQSGLDS